MSVHSSPNLISSGVPALLRDLSGGLTWVVAIVPAAIGFWVVAADLAGVQTTQLPTLLVASLLAMGLATLGQALLGYRLPLFEGPGGSYLAAIAVVAGGSAPVSPDQVTGGLLLAGAIATVVGLLGVGRVLTGLLTPAVSVAFLLITVLMVLPGTLSRALDSSGGQPLGTPAAWLAAIGLVAVTFGVGRRPRLRPYALLLGLLTGIGIHVAVAGGPPDAIHADWDAPALLPWGLPDFQVAVAGPFVIAGLLGSFNAVATAHAVAAEPEPVERPSMRDDETGRRGLVVHGGAVILSGFLGNILGNVPRLDSVGIAKLLGSRRVRPLILASCTIILVGLTAPLIGLLAAMPVSVPAALALVVLVTMLHGGSRSTRSLPRARRWLVVLPAVAPSLVWILIGGTLPTWALLLANPMAMGVVLAVLCDQLLTRLSRNDGRALTPGDE